MKKEKNEKADQSPFGELTQRLVQGLMEENMMTQVWKLIIGFLTVQCGIHRLLISALNFLK